MPIKKLRIYLLMNNKINNHFQYHTHQVLNLENDNGKSNNDLISTTISYPSNHSNNYNNYNHLNHNN